MEKTIISNATNHATHKQDNLISSRVRVLCWIAVAAGLLTLLAASPLTAALLPFLMLPTVSCL